MKKLFIVFVVLGLLIAAKAYAIPFEFYNITNNNVVDAAFGEAQLSVEVTNQALNDYHRVGFTFENSGPELSSITQVYFDDNSGILSGFSPWDPFFDYDDPGVDFSTGASPGNLPGGDPFGFAADFSAGSESPVQPNGVNPTETLGIRFDLESGISFDNVVAAINSGALRIGIHVQGFASDGSESFITSNISSVPEPAAMLLLGGGLICFAVVGRKKFFKKD